MLLSVNKMDIKDVKKSKNLYLLGGIAFFLVLATICAFSFHYSAKERQSVAYAFDGWYFGREDQKKVGAVLSAAGLDEYSWDSGKLSVPTAKKNEYQSALAVAGAYPKAPSESRLEALRESSVFESDSKLRMRELNACATQLERTIEQMRGVEYATVGYRSRREQSGLIAKNVVTASIGVALKEGAELDANFIAAVTISAKHQLGIDEADDVSILDLKAGKSYLGVDNSRNSGASDVAILEKERVENYWREKFLEAFGDIEGVRVSVVADLIDEKEAAKDEEKSSGARLDFNRDALELRVVSYSKPNENQDFEDAKNARGDSGFARLGNPKKKDASANDSNRIQTLASAEEKDVAPAKIQPLEKERLGRRVENALVLASRSSNEETFSQEARVANKTNYLEDANSFYSARSRRASNDGGVAQASYFEKNDSNVGRRASNAAFVLRSIIVRIAVPESYVQRVFQRVVAEKSKEKTFEEESPEKRESLYRETETKIVEETKKFAVALFRPTGERLGWNDDALENSFYVDVFADASTPRAADTVNFVSKYASFDVLESAPKSKEQIETEKDAGAFVTDAKSSEGGAMAETFGKIAEIASEDEPATDEKPSWNGRARSFFDVCLKIAKSKRAIYAGLASFVAAAFFFFLCFKYKKNLAKKRKARVNVAASSGADSESIKIPNLEGTSRNVDADSETYDDELERELLNFASSTFSKRVERREEGTSNRRVDSIPSKERDFWEERRTALDFIAKYPERAVASLQGWVKNPS